jgi:hypothetical protein
MTSGRADFLFRNGCERINANNICALQLFWFHFGLIAKFQIITGRNSIKGARHFL